MRKLPVIFFLCWCASAEAQTVSIPITVQEALFPGGSTGVARTNEPFCRETGGVPIPDSVGLTNTSTLTLTGASVSAGQFRITGTWPSGNVKWLQVCGILPSLSAGGTATVTLANNGSGNFGGNNLASLAGSTITVNNTGGATSCGVAGATCFTIKAAGNFNGIDTVTIGATTLVATHSTPASGLVLLGPTPGSFPTNTQCGAGCATVYSSANDANSTCSIEINGPVMADVVCYGTHKDGSGNPYMHFTSRLYFFKGKNYAVVEVIPRNADYSTAATPSADCNVSAGACIGQTFNVSYKNFQSYELREPLTGLSGTITATIANHTVTPTSTTLTGSDNVDIYQGQSSFFDPCLETASDYVSNACIGSTAKNTWTPDTGYHITKNGTDLTSGTSAQFPQGWADCTDGSGNGVLIGSNLFAAYWPKSLEFFNACTEMRIGIRPNENSVTSFLPWPAWDMQSGNILFLEFHTSNPASLSNDFLSLQHFLAAYPAFASVNTANVFYGHTILPPTQEDNYFLDLANKAIPIVPTSNFCSGGVAPCRPDRGTSSAIYSAGQFRGYSWNTGGAGNQEEFRWDDMLRYFQRGQTGRYLTSLNFYRFLGSVGWPHSDGTNVTGSDGVVNHFQWKDRPQQGQTTPELDNRGNPIVTSTCQSATNSPVSCAHVTNSGGSYTSWAISGGGDAIHAHWYGAPDAYFLTGDESIRESLWGVKSWFLNPNTFQGGSLAGGTACGNQAFCFARAKGIAMMGAARFGAMLAATGDTDAANVLAEGTFIFDTWVKPDVCVKDGSGNVYPTGCTPPPVTSYASPVDPQGISRVRGSEFSARAAGWCPKNTGSNSYRISQSFQHSILEKGIFELQNIKGTSWNEYELAGDLAFGTARFVLTEMLNDDKGMFWQSANSNGFFPGLRFIMPTDIANACSTPSNQLDTSGTVTTAASAVTWVSGIDFTNVNVNDSIGINGTQLVVCTKTDSTHLVVSATNDCTTSSATPGSGLNIGAGTNTTAVPWVQGLVTPVAYSFSTTTTKSGNGFLAIAGGVNGTATTAPAFPADPSSPWDNLQIGIGGGQGSTVAAVPSTTTLTLNTSVSNNANVGFSINPGIYQVGSNTYDVGTVPYVNQGEWDVFNTVANVTKDTTWRRIFNYLMQGVAYHISNAPDFGSVDLWDNINALNSTTSALRDVPITNFSNPGGDGNYQFSFTTPPGATSPLRIKWCGQPIQTDLTQILKYDNLVTQTFGINPATNCAWFAANTTTEPVLTPGVQQTVTIATATNGLSAANFSVKVATPNIVWTDALPLTCSPQPNPCYNGYHTIRYDPFTQRTWIYSTDTAGGAESIYSVRLAPFNSNPPAYGTVTTDNNQPAANGCLASTATLPPTHHPFDMWFNDTKRNRLWTFQGVCGGYVPPEMWYCQLVIGPPPGCSGGAWVRVQPPHMPINTTIHTGTTLSAAITTTTRPTTISVTSNKNICEGTTLQIDSEIVVVSGTGRLWADGTCGVSGVGATVTISAPVLGTTAATHLINATVSDVDGPYNNGAIAFDSDDDMFLLYGFPAPGSNSHALWAYCDTSGTGTLTANQTAVGCTNPDDFTDLTIAGTTCTDPACLTSGAGKVPPGIYYPVVEYDSVHHYFIFYAGCCGALSKIVSANTDTMTFKYTPTTKTFVNLAPACFGIDCQPGQENGALAPPAGSINGEAGRVAHAEANGLFYYHFTGPHGPPVAPAVLTITQDWVLDPTVPSWTELQTGTGPSTTESMAYDSVCNCLISWATALDANNKYPNNGIAHVWIGALPATAQAAGPTGVSLPWTLSGNAGKMSGTLVRK
jgi:hypothetical protein